MVSPACASIHWATGTNFLPKACRRMSQRIPKIICRYRGKTWIEQKSFQTPETCPLHVPCTSPPTELSFCPETRKDNGLVHLHCSSCYPLPLFYVGLDLLHGATVFCFLITKLTSVLTHQTLAEPNFDGGDWELMTHWREIPSRS